MTNQLHENWPCAPLWWGLIGLMWQWNRKFSYVHELCCISSVNHTKTNWKNNMNICEKLQNYPPKSWVHGSIDTFKFLLRFKNCVMPSNCDSGRRDEAAFSSKVKWQNKTCILYSIRRCKKDFLEWKGWLQKWSIILELRTCA